MQESNKKIRVVGISGVATAGKDTFASILINKLHAAGKTTKRIALANALKADMDAFCDKYFGFSSFTQNIEEKTLIRPGLVWYGDAQRQRTGGRYWIDIVNNQVDSTDADYAIITDIRYSHYPKDEINWVLEEKKGIVVHVSQYTFGADIMGSNVHYVQPANAHESLNDPKVKAQASHRVEWEKIPYTDTLLDNPILNKHVDEFIAKFNLI